MVIKKNMSYDIVGIGNAIVDIIAEVDDKYLSQNNIDKGSMSLIDFEIANKIGSEVEIIKIISGGSVANSIVGISQQGLKTAFIGKVNHDDLGNEFKKGLMEENVEFKYSPDTSQNYTGRCIILVTSDAERTMNTYLGISQQLTENDIDMKVIENSSILYLEGYLWDLDEAKNAIKKSILKAKASSTLVAFSMSDAFCVDRFREEFFEIVNDFADIIFANESEIKSLFQTDDLEYVKNECMKKNKIFAITLGSKGALIIKQNEIFKIDPEIIDNLVDTTGAGDLFAAGFLSEYIKSQQIDSCGKFGVKLASQIIQRFGARL
jgi:sugar/nucleoside kinase (ribokinase family)|tara:strand:- start:4019 stop:4981 length:963 start_codon:yes stop_codon:yes gene_type:complete